MQTVQTKAKKAQQIFLDVTNACVNYEEEINRLRKSNNFKDYKIGELEKELKKYKSNQMKECPFCSGDSYLETHENDLGRRFHLIYCIKCGIEVSDTNRQKLVSKWNKRINQGRDSGSQH